MHIGQEWTFDQLRHLRQQSTDLFIRTEDDFWTLKELILEGEVRHYW